MGCLNWVEASLTPGNPFAPPVRGAFFFGNAVSACASCTPKWPHAARAYWESLAATPKTPESRVRWPPSPNSTVHRRYDAAALAFANARLLKQAIQSATTAMIAT